MGLIEIELNLDTLKIEESIEEMSNKIREALGEINTSIAEFNSSNGSMGESVNVLTGVLSAFSGSLSTLVIEGNTFANVNKNLESVFSMMSGSVGIAVAAVAGFIGVVALLCSSMDNEYAKHKETMDAINKEIEARNEMIATQQENVAASDSEMNNLQGLNNELSSLIDTNGKVKAGYEDRAAFIVSVLNKALGEQIKIENGVVTGYDASSDSIDNKIAKMKAEAILEAQLPAYKKALLEASNAQMKADKMAMEVSDLKMQKEAKEAELIKKYGKDWRENSAAQSDSLAMSYFSLQADTLNKEAEFDKQKEITEGYYDDISNYETNAALIASGNAENYAKVQMDTVNAKGQSVEEKKAYMEAEIEAENGQIEALKERRANATDEEIKRQLDAQIAAAEQKAAGYEDELNQLSEYEKKVTELKQLDNEEDMLLLGQCIDDKQAKLTEMYATEEEDWTASQKKKADGLKQSITDELNTYTQYAGDKVSKAIDLSTKLNENSTQEEKDAAASAMREAQSTLEILQKNVNDKIAKAEDITTNVVNTITGVFSQCLGKVVAFVKIPLQNLTNFVKLLY